MTSESNQTPAQSSQSNDMPNVGELPPVGDLSKLSDEPTPPLGLSAIDAANSPSKPIVESIKTIPSATKPASGQPPIVVPTSPSGFPFASSQAVPADPIPAALAAKETQKAEAVSESSSSAQATGATAQAQTKNASQSAAAASSSAPGTSKDADAAPGQEATDQTTGNSTATPPNVSVNVIQEAPQTKPDAESKPAKATTPADTQPAPALVEGNHAPQVRFKNEQGKLLLILPSENEDSSGQNTLSYAWPEIMNQLRQRLQAESRHWESNTAIHLVARDRLLNAQQLQDIVEALAQQQMQLRRVYTSRRQTATTAATAGYSVEQHVAVSQINPAPTEAGTAMAEPLVLKTTLRSGVEIRHNGTVVVIGDLNPGSAIIAEGDIVIWGRLRGNVHAGYKGDNQARIMALRMEPAQIRIAGFVARGPSKPPTQFFPEVAYVTAQGKISIARVEDTRTVPGPSTKETRRDRSGQRPIGRKMPATGKRNF